VPKEASRGRFPEGQIRKGRKEEEPERVVREGFGQKRGKIRRDDTLTVYSGSRRGKKIPVPAKDEDFRKCQDKQSFIIATGYRPKKVIALTDSNLRPYFYSDNKKICLHFYISNKKTIFAGNKKG